MHRAATVAFGAASCLPRAARIGHVRARGRLTALSPVYGGSADARRLYTHRHGQPLHQAARHSRLARHRAQQHQHYRHHVRACLRADGPLKGSSSASAAAADSTPGSSSPSRCYASESSSDAGASSTAGSTAIPSNNASSSPVNENVPFAKGISGHTRYPNIVEGDKEPRDYYRGEIFCNRALNMTRIAAVGFDMDYTIAQYYSEKFESLSAQGAISKLVHKLGYPKPLLDLKYDHSYFIRGLVVDKVRGNILKLDRHKYVKSGLHGFRQMSKQERAIYDQITVSGGGFLEPQYALLDTIFSLPDAFLFSALVQYKDDHPGSIHQEYAQIYKDVRRSVDMCHRDGSIKDVVSANPEEYIQNNPGIFDMLHALRASGRKVFLLTNSFADYTNTVMSYLYRAAGHGDGSTWQDVFDVIITGSCKPPFIVDPYRPLYRCDIKTGTLTNTEGPYEESPEEYLARGKSFQGGNYTHLHNILGVANGTQVLYVGDHIYADIVRSKRTLGWRTMLIIPELEHEINVLNHADVRALASLIDEKRLKRDDLDEWIDFLERELTSPDTSNRITPDRRAKIIKERDSARVEMEAIRSDIMADTETLHKMFHPVWGQLFKSGAQNSRFAEQVENYACLYTSTVTNIRYVSPEFYWRTMPDLMPHDRFHATPMHRMIEARRRRAVADGT